MSTPNPDICLYSGGGINGTQARPLLWQALNGTAYTTLILWLVGVDDNGNFDMNGDMAVDGNIPYDSRVMAGQIQKAVAASSIQRVGISFGTSTLLRIKNLYGVNHRFTHNLTRNLLAVKQQYNVTFVDYDDEGTYSLAASMNLALLANSLGLGITICPYTNPTFWTQFVTTANTVVPGLCSSIFLQCYSGGGFNTPGSWASVASATGINITPGLWATTGGGGSTPAQVTTQFTSWRQSATLAGGFMFVGTEMIADYTPSPLGSPSAYAQAIQSAFSGA